MLPVPQVCLVPVIIYLVAPYRQLGPGPDREPGSVLGEGENPARRF